MFCLQLNYKSTSIFDYNQCLTPVIQLSGEHCILYTVLTGHFLQTTKICCELSCRPFMHKNAVMPVFGPPKNSWTSLMNVPWSGLCETLLLSNLIINVSPCGTVSYRSSSFARALTSRIANSISVKRYEFHSRFKKLTYFSIYM